jgi:hypothetical protein
VIGGPRFLAVRMPGGRGFQPMFNNEQEELTMIRLSKLRFVFLALVCLMILATPALAVETKGKIKSVNADKSELVLTDDNGKDWTFELAKDGKVQLNNKDGKFSDLRKGDEVTITYEKKGEKLMANEIRCTRK